MKDYAVQLSNVSKKFDNAPILHDISLEIHHNTKLAILGHNGSGKSSLLKLIANIYMPNSGEIQTFGKKIGYVPEHFPDQIRFKLSEYLLQVGMISGKPKEVVQKQINNYISLFHLEAFSNTLLKHCSKGTKQKAGLIQALLTDCDILLLDEPLTGLDDDSKKIFLEVIQKIDRDLTILFTAHEQETVDLLAEEVLILEHGRIIKYEAITERTKMKSILANISQKLDMEELKVYGQLTKISDSRVELTVRAIDCDACLLYLLENDCSIIEVKEKI